MRAPAHNTQKENVGHREKKLDRPLDVVGIAPPAVFFNDARG
jgi:hypothetical protein